MIHLEPAQLQCVLDILKKQVPHLEVRAFGSRVHGHHLKPFSDLDLALMTSQPLTLVERARLQEAFSESLLPIKVDLVEWSEISDDFRALISNTFEILQNPSR